MTSLDPRWPNLFIPGAPKSGTTSLHRYLAQHPEVFMSEPKEPHFFSFDWDETEDDPKAFAERRERYLELFERGQALPVRGESTPGYLHREPVAQRIHDTVPHARFVILLRDPIERAHSDHAMLVRKGSESRSFLEVVRAELAASPGEERYHIERGLYDVSVGRYLDLFGDDHVHVVLFEDLKRNTLGVLHDVAHFLGVDDGAMARVDHETVHNPGGKPRNALAQWLLTDPRVHRAAQRLVPKELRIYLGDHVLIEKDEKPPLEAEAVALLVEVFEPSVARLEERLGRELSELRKVWASTSTG